MRLIEQREVSFDAGSQRRLEERLEGLARQDDPVWNGYVQSDEPRQRACLSTSGTLVYGVDQRNHPTRHAALAFPTPPRPRAADCMGYPNQAPP